MPTKNHFSHPSAFINQDKAIAGRVEVCAGTLVHELHASAKGPPAICLNARNLDAEAEIQADTVSTCSFDTADESGTRNRRDNVLANAEQLHAQQAIQRFAVAIVSKGIKTRCLFERLDSDGDHHLSTDELSRLMKPFQPHLTDKDIRAIFEYFDSDGNGRISSEEFEQSVIMAASAIIEPSYGSTIVQELNHSDRKNLDPTFAWESVKEALALETVCSNRSHTNVIPFSQFQKEASSYLNKSGAVC